MANKISKINKANKTYAKRLSKGQRIHVRRMKQEARKGVSITHS